MWHLIRASVFDNSISIEKAQQQSGASTTLPETFTGLLRSADQVADLRFANAKHVAAHDRLMKEIVSGRNEEQRIEEELVRVEQKDHELRQTVEERVGRVRLTLSRYRRSR